ncbi:MAG: tRNA-dihydrouridine synthase [Nanoarchaeota archaeon]
MNLKPLRIGNITLKNRIFLSPMVDITDAAYRQICREAGAGLAYIEMLNIGAILHPNPKTQMLMKTFDKESPKAIQITGKTVEEFKRVLPYLKSYDLIDINCGCPSTRTTDNESGAYLLKDPEKIAEMIKVLKQAGHTVTVKIRLGFKNNNVMEIAKIIETAGADALTIHARLAWHGNNVPADWQWIAKVKEAVKIPVIGNGDIDSPKKAEAMLEIADGCMIARAAIGNPFIFKQIIHYAETGEELAFNFQENFKYFDRYLNLTKKYNVIDIPKIKSIGSNFLREVKGASKLRQELMQCKTIQEIESFIGKLSQLSF